MGYICLLWDMLKTMFKSTKEKIMIKLLDCTLRDGGYVNNWEFGQQNILRVIQGLTDANLDMIEIGYLNQNAIGNERSFFKTIEEASRFIPKNKCNTIYLAMIDIGRFALDDIVDYKDGYIDGIRVAFYKHQIQEAMQVCERVVQAGYKLFAQPMVTADYTDAEYISLIDKLVKIKPYAVSIVDSFGYMNREDIKRYFDILDLKLDKDCIIGFHAHNNMQLAVSNALSLFEYNTDRVLIIDASLSGMGRAAGNLNTELIATYYNQNIENKYNISNFINLISDIIYPIYKKLPWGYSPYYFLTAKYGCHPGYATYILNDYEVPVSELEEFLKTITGEYKIKCKKDQALEFFVNFRKNNKI